MATKPESSGPAGLPEEEGLLRQARALLPALPESEPRPGFAQRVAARAMDERPRPWGAPWWRWVFGGAALAGGAAAFLLVLAPREPAAGTGSVVQVAAPAEPELLLAQRLDLYEDLAVVQDQEALEELDVVSVLHELSPGGEPARPEGKP